MSEEHGIDYVLRKTNKLEISGMADLSKLQNQVIPLDHLSSSSGKTDILEKRKEQRNNRKHKWKSLATRSFRKKYQTINKSTITFEKIKPIADLWDSYADRIKDGEANIAKMDFHGALIKVISSPDPSITGVTGRVLKESYGAIIVVTKDDEVKQINKKHTVIHIISSKGTYEVNLSAIRCRPSLRTSKKWKARTPIELPF